MKQNIEYSHTGAAVPTYLLFLSRKKLSESPGSTAAVKPQLGRVRAYQPYANALRLRSKVQTRFSAKYACAQPNVGVSSAVFRSGVSSVQWQLEQKKGTVLLSAKHGPEIEGF